MTNQMILGLDPGRDKCGLAVMGLSGQLHYHEVVQSERAIATLQALCEKFPIDTVVMGDRTTASSWKQKLQSDLAEVPIVLVDEHYTTLEARDRYWQMYPPQGFGRLIPQGLRQPPRPVDDIVAIILIERYLSGSREQRSGGAGEHGSNGSRRDAKPGKQ